MQEDFAQPPGCPIHDPFNTPQALLRPTAPTDLISREWAKEESSVVTRGDFNPAVGEPNSDEREPIPTPTPSSVLPALFFRSMMITLSLLILGLCFFLHRKLKSNAGTVSLHTLPWTDENLEIYTLSGQEEIAGIYLPPTPSPPPAYEVVVKVHKKEDAEALKKSVSDYNPVKKIIPEDDDLPSYETAIKLREQGYI